MRCYPIIKKQITSFYSLLQKEVTIIDSAETVAKALKSYLEYNQLVSKTEGYQDEFKVSDITPAFEQTARIFFGEEVNLERIPIWDEYQ